MEFSKEDKLRMRRCFYLASLGSYHVQTNPQVGALIVKDGVIIGEGYHKKYGGPHAEIEALASVANEHQALIEGAHMYVSLEPCYHEGKTPPCVDAIIKAKIAKVSISVQDPNPKTAGMSIAKLIDHDIDVQVGLLEKEGRELILPFFVHQRLGLPYIVLKWAQSKDRYIGKPEAQIWLSNQQSKFLVHRWREEIDAIMIGTNTAIIDNPRLTNRRGHGRSPVRIVLDRYEKIPKTHHVLSDGLPTVVYTTVKDYKANGQKVTIHHLPEELWNVETILKSVHQLGYAKLMIEGGKKLLAHCIKANLWHEARIIQTTKIIGDGIKAPNLSGKIRRKTAVLDDNLFIISNLNNKLILI